MNNANAEIENRLRYSQVVSMEPLKPVSRICGESFNGVFGALVCRLSPGHFPATPHQPEPMEETNATD